jgi:hypothetical protein
MREGTGGRKNIVEMWNISVYHNEKVLITGHIWAKKNTVASS